MQHCVTNVFTIAPMTDAEYLINQGPASYSYQNAVFSDLDCRYDVTHVATFKKEGVTVDQPDFIIWDEATQQFTVEATSPD